MFLAVRRVLPALFFLSLFACPESAEDVVTDVDAAVDSGNVVERRDAQPDRPTDPDWVEAPVLDSLSPDQALLESTGPEVVVKGKNFVARSVVQLDGAVLATTFVSPSEMRAVVPNDKLTRVGDRSISVGTAPPGGGASKSLPFHVLYPAPTFDSLLDPKSAPIGSPGVTLSLVGDKIMPGATVRFENEALTSTVADKTHVSAVVPARLLTQSGLFKIRIENPTPGGGLSTPIVFAVTNPSVVLQSVTPGMASVGSQATSISLSGSGFQPASAVTFNGTILSSTFQSSTALMATIPATLLATVGEFPVVIQNPAPGGGLSVPVSFRVAHAVPSLTTISPTGGVVGSPAITLNLDGTGFEPASLVTVNNGSVATNYVSPTSLQATLPSSSFMAPGTLSIRVVNPAPGGGTSNAVNFAVDNPAPQVTTLIPSRTLYVASGDATVSVQGNGFIPSSVVRVNGSSLVTSYVSGTQVVAALPGAFLATPVTLGFVVVNNAPGGGTSGTVNLSIGCDPTGVNYKLSVLNSPTTISSGLTSASAPTSARFTGGGACPTSVNSTNTEPYKAVVVQNTSSAPATLAAWAFCRSTKDTSGTTTSEDDAFMTIYRTGNVPVTATERAACTPVVSEGLNGFGKYTSPDANGSNWCPGLTKTNNGGIPLAVCEKAVVYLQPYNIASTRYTAPLSLKVSLQ